MFAMWFGELAAAFSGDAMAKKGQLADGGNVFATNFFHDFKIAVGYVKAGKEIPARYRKAYERWQEGVMKAGLMTKERYSGPSKRALEIFHAAAPLYALEGLTLRECADRLEVNYEVLKKLVQRHREIFNSICKDAIDRRKNEISEEIERAQIHAYSEYARISRKAARKIEDVLTRNDVSPSVALEAAKHVHEVIGVSPSATKSKTAHAFFSEDKKKLIADTLGIVFAAQERAKELAGGREIIEVEPEVVEEEVTDNGQV